ncbi:MAG: IMPACT family protein [Sphingobacterium thalpophilum]
MLFDDTYYTIHDYSEGIYRDKGSRFMAYLFPVTSDSQIKEVIASLKAKHPKARHCCWAFRLCTDKSVFRLNDDGEPSGTAGRPILNTLLSNEITNVLAVVVRYFGGTLLGVPGLINAYKSATIDAINNAKIINKTVNSVFIINFNHSQMNDVMKIIKEEDLKIQNQNFDIYYSFVVEIRHSQVDKVLGKLEKLEGLNWISRKA